MKTVFLFLLALVAIISFGCEDILSDREKIYTEIGWINDYDSLQGIPPSIVLGSSIQTDIKILWSDGCKFNSFFEVQRESEFVYIFTLKDESKGQLCTLDIRSATTSFKFKPERKGTYTLKFVDRTGTRNKILIVE